MSREGAGGAGRATGVAPTNAFVGAMPVARPARSVTKWDAASYGQTCQFVLYYSKDCRGGQRTNHGQPELGNRGAYSSPQRILVNHKEFAMDFEAYCVKCRTKRPIKSGTVKETANGRQMAQGTCPVCGTKVQRFLPASKETPAKASK